jgi:multidrug resistance efflux pump
MNEQALPGQVVNENDQTGESPDRSSNGSSGWRPPPAGYLGIGIAAAVGLAGTLAILAAWKLPPFRTAVQTTADAYVKGRTTVISPQVSGYVVQVLAQDYQHVKTGELLLKIDDRTYQQKVDQARAEVDVALANLANNDQTIASKRAAVNSADAAVSSAQAQLSKAETDLQRASELVHQGSGSQAELDDTRAATVVARAMLEQARAAAVTANEDVKSAQVQGRVLTALIESARAQLGQAEIDLSHTEIRAMESGQLSDIGVRLGQNVTNGSQLFFLVPDSRWVTANYKETQTSRMAVGQKAWFTVDALDGRRFPGRVDQLSPAAGSEFSILRPDNATGNFTKVPQRIPVRIIIDQDPSAVAALRPGMSVEAYIDTGP